MAAEITPHAYELDTDLELESGPRERWLLLLAGLFVVVNHLAFLLARHSGIADAWPIGVWLGCVAVGYLLLERSLPRRDPFIFPIVMLLSGWGLTLIARLAPPFALRQTVWLLISGLALVVIVWLPHNLRWLSRYRYLWLVGGIGLLIATILLGRNPAGYGPRLWLGIFDAYFQPSELLKVILVVFLASYLAENRDLLAQGRQVGRLRLPSLRYLAPLVVMWGLSGLILIWQRDLGTATLFFMVFLGMLYVATGRWLYVVGGLVLLIAAGAVAYFMFDVVKLRFDIWFNPWPQADNQAFQIVQSLFAFASGGVFGQGVAQGSPTYIPVVHSDFVFSAIGEEWGLLGTLSVLACLAILALRALRLAAASEARPFRAMLAAGIGLNIATQSFLIMGGTIKLIPLTGVTLPFLSYGGSSLLTNFVMIGLLLVLSQP